jgi:hypothetical protein
VKAVAAGLAFAVLITAGTAVASDQFLLLRLDGNHVKWGAPSLGTSAQVRYAFVSSAMASPGAINCEAMVPLDAMLESSRIDRARFRQEVAAAFALWHGAADIAFVEASDPATADILIGAEREPRGFAFTNVAYDQAGTAPVRRIEKSLICFNPDKHWKVGFDGNMDVYDIRYAITHEIGHAIGLDHPSPSGELMSFRYGEDFRTLQEGDVSGAVALYGRRGAPAVAAVQKPGPPAPDMALR